MTPLVWASFSPALLFLLAWVGHPLRMTLRHPGIVPGRAAHAYLAASACHQALLAADRNY